MKKLIIGTLVALSTLISASNVIANPGEIELGNSCRYIVKPLCKDSNGYPGKSFCICGSDECVWMCVR